MAQHTRQKAAKWETLVEASDLLAPPPPSHTMRAALLVGASMLAMTGMLLTSRTAAAAPCSPSSQVITTSVPGPINSDGGSITIVASGSVNNMSGAGVQVGCPATTIDNAGRVSSVSAAVLVQDVGSVGTLTNSGTIRGGGILSSGISNSGTIGQLTNSGAIDLLTNSGAISGGVGNSGTIGQLTNSGIITGPPGFRIFLATPASVTPVPLAS